MISRLWEKKLPILLTVKYASDIVPQRIVQATDMHDSNRGMYRQKMPHKYIGLNISAKCTWRQYNMTYNRDTYATDNKVKCAQ